MGAASPSMRPSPASSMADVTNLHRLVATRARQAQVLAAADMKTRYRNAAPYKSGATQASVDVINFTVTPTQLRCTAVATTPQAKWTDEGTRAHTIRARKGKALRFRIGGRTYRVLGVPFVESGGSVVFAKSVKIPAYKGTKWFRNTGPREWHGALQRAYQRLG